MIAVTCIMFSVSTTQAIDINFNVADGNWTNLASWSPAQLPTASDVGRVYNGRIARVTTNGTCGWLYLTVGSGRVDMTGGTLEIPNYLVVGQSGPGFFTQTGGTVNSANVRLGQNVAAAYGEYTISDGTLNVSSSIYIAQQGTGIVTQTGGSINVGSINYIGMDAGSYGRYEISGGAYTGRTTVANNGTAYIKQSGGIFHFKTGGLNIAGGVTGTGTYELVDGTLIAEENMYVGGTGEGTFLFGDENTTGSLIETNGSRRLMIGSLTGGGTGVFRGWGTVGLTQRLLLYANGTLIADGYGVDRTLDLTPMDPTMQTYTNAAGKAGGIYAQNHGKILFPTLNIGTYTYYIGESDDNKTTNVVNCSVLTLNMQTGTTLSGAVLATDRDDVNKKARLAGVWEFVLGNPAVLNTATITFRYDDIAAATLGIPENELELLRPEGDSWKTIPATIDTTRHIITSDTLTNIDGQFAVGVRCKGTVVIVH